jgi:hypothetical protein
MGNATEAQKFHLVRPKEASASIKLWGKTAFSSLDEATRDTAMALYKKVPGFNGPARRFTPPSISGSACAPPKRKKKTKPR